MWYEISSERDINDFMKKINFFHDCCIKELKLNVAFQCQSEENGMFELEFQGLKYLKLLPLDETYTCEILDATMFMQNELIYWCDCGGLSEADLDDYMGTVICAEKLRWRSIINHMGDREFY